MQARVHEKKKTPPNQPTPNLSLYDKITSKQKGKIKTINVDAGRMLTSHQRERPQNKTIILRVWL